MIFDEIKNISKYSEIPQVAIDFIKNLTADIPCGRHEIAEGIYANVEEYSTKNLSAAKFEAHRKYADIQLLINGVERIDFTTRNGQEVIETYDENRDIEFFEYGNSYVTSCYMEGGNFVVFFPEELHAPQISPDGLNKPVKKVVVKVRM